MFDDIARNRARLLSELQIKSDLIAALKLFLAVPDNKCGHRTFRDGCRCCIGKAAIAKAKGALA